MPKMGITHVQSALGLILALKDGGVEQELEKLKIVADENNDLLAKANADQAAADALKNRSEALIAEYEGLLKEVEQREAAVSKRENENRIKKIELDRRVSEFTAESKSIMESLEQDKAETAKALSNAKRAKTNAERNEQKSEQIRVDLEQRQARLTEAMR